MAEFAYNNTKNGSTGFTLFEFNCGYYLKVFFKENIDPRLESCFINKLNKKLRKLIKVYFQNLFYAQKL